jgi:RHS repeat-associated protein
LKSNIKFIAPILVTVFLVFALAYGINTKFEPLLSIFSQSNPDSTDTPPDFTFNKDVSQMFNERGFYKSNGFSFDENEIINDFNGGLMYEIPLYSFKQSGDMKFDVKLVYNGSVGHKVILCDSAHYSNLFNVYSYNINSPEWILSINGIAVQVFNFETNFFTKRIVNNEINNNDVNMLIPGYHFDDDMRVINSGDRDRINILMGDGSAITLVNISNTNSYVGTYYSEGKESYYKANVYFDEQTGDGAYRNRFVELSMGDGLVYIFHEYKRKFTDLDLLTGLTYMRPQMLLLEAVKDQFGNKITLNYEFNQAPSTFGGILYGHPLFAGVNSNSTGNCSFYMLYSGNLIKIAHNSSVNGSYFFTIDPQVYFVNSDNNGAANNIASFTKIRNPLFQEANIHYYENPYYKRTLADVPNAWLNYNLDVVFSNLRRIKDYTNFLGGYREYTYYGDNNISITYAANTFNASSQYIGYGRDPFYTNMLNRKKDKDEQGVWKSQTSYTYYYQDKGGSFAEYPVDASDSLNTTIEITSLDQNNINNSASDFKKIKYYKIFPLKFPYNNNTFPPETSVYEFNGSTKLIQDETIEMNSGTIYQNTLYTYETGNQPGGLFNGSMLMSTNKNFMKGIERDWLYSYGYDGTDNEKDKPVIFKSETDPKGIKTETNFLNLDTMFFFNLAMAGYNGEKETTQSYYYKIGLPYQVIKKDGSNNIIAKNTTGFLRILNDIRGYYGQLISDKIFAAPDFSAGIETNYEYYKMDTIGHAFYSGGTMPYKEGNLKIVKKPDGEEEVYYYHPISFYEDETYNSAQTSPIHPNISFRKKYNTGSVTIEKDFLVDNRLPIRIDNFKRISTNSVNLLKTVYFKYNEAGYPTKIINENRYVTELVYQPTHRISSITLPGDYSTTVNDTTPVINHFYYYDTVNVSCTGFGHRNELTSIKQLNFLNAPQYLRDCPIFYMWYKKTASTMTFQHPAFIRFENVPVFNQVFTAEFSFPVLKYVRTKDGSPIGENIYYTTIKPFSSLGSVTQDLSCGGRNWFKSTTSAVENLSQNITIDTSASGTYKIQTYDVKSMLDNLSSYHKKLEGIYIMAGLKDAPEPLPNHELRLEFINTNLTEQQWANEWYNWLQNAPKLSIYGEVDVSDTIKLVTIYGGTYLYSYDDTRNIITTYSRLTHSPNVLKKVRYFIDGFGNIKNKYIFNNTSDSNKFSYSYNYLLKLASEIDGTGDTTWHSNDLLGRDSITTHQDHSSGTQGNQYLSSLTTAFYTISGGFIEKQTYTDETGRLFNKYFDAIGNLIREEKFVAGDGNGNIQEGDNPFDPDTTYQGQDVPGQMISLITDYEYDNLYRLTRVRTPGEKIIQYWYDGYGRQMQRNTPDAGLTKYNYDNNSNLILSQDANQRALDAILFTKRTYDGLNRLLTIGDFKPANYTPPGGTGFGGDTTIPFEFDFINGNPDSIYVINVYDTLTSAVYDIFNSNKPSDFGSTPNYTRGRLIATAYRTRLGDGWGFKFYRYDERGNAVKLWHNIEGLSWKTENYYYNSQNQLTRKWYQANNTDSKLFIYGYDDAGRLSYTNLYVGATPEDPENEGDYPNAYLTMASYSYNADQQVAAATVNNSNPYTMTNAYNNRNWLKQSFKSSGVFGYTLNYNPNGNIRSQVCFGTYVNNFNSQGYLNYTYTYDNSNRLLKADEAAGSSFDMINNYDKDGNFKNMKRYGSSNNLADNFQYSYISGTNKLQSITGYSNYSYDYNGNVSYDDINKNTEIKYDWRNLLTENKNILSQSTYKTFYKYDEAGNRINKKQYLYVNGTPPGGTGSEGGGGGFGDSIIVDPGDGSGYWAMAVNIYYVRDAGGKEIAVYNSNNIEQWNIYGLDNVGKINSDNKRYFYLKDHLGSIRAVLDTTNTVVSAQDYDCWGYLIENRTYENTAMRYKFTGKERDKDLENNYDYFGARYYDSRIANWTSVDPLFEKHIQWTPYNYVLRNPEYFYDPNGSQVAGVWKLTYEIAKKTAQTAAPFIGIPLSIPAFIANLVLSPEQFGYAELKDLKPQSPYIIGEEGYLESIIPTGVIDVTALSSEIYIPEEDKIPLEELNPPRERGFAPTSKETGKPIEIHHVGQSSKGPWKEMKWQEHRGKGNYKKHHDTSKESEISKQMRDQQRKSYWEKEWDRGRFENIK